MVGQFYHLFSFTISLVRVGWSFTTRSSSETPMVVKSLSSRSSFFSLECSIPLASEHISSSSRPHHLNFRSSNVWLLVSRCSEEGTTRHQVCYVYLSTAPNINNTSTLCNTRCPQMNATLLNHYSTGLKLTNHSIF